MKIPYLLIYIISEDKMNLSNDVMYLGRFLYLNIVYKIKHKKLHLCCINIHIVSTLNARMYATSDVMFGSVPIPIWCIMPISLIVKRKIMEWMGNTHHANVTS